MSRGIQEFDAWVAVTADAQRQTGPGLRVGQYQPGVPVAIFADEHPLQRRLAAGERDIRPIDHFQAGLALPLTLNVPQGDGLILLVLIERQARHGSAGLRSAAEHEAAALVAFVSEENDTGRPFDSRRHVAPVDENRRLPIGIRQNQPHAAIFLDDVDSHVVNFLEARLLRRRLLKRRGRQEQENERAAERVRLQQAEGTTKAYVHGRLQTAGCADGAPGTLSGYNCSTVYPLDLSIVSRPSGPTRCAAPTTTKARPERANSASSF